MSSLSDLIGAGVFPGSQLSISDRLYRFFSAHAMGTVAPESVVTADVGAEYTNVTTGRRYHKTSGSGNTGWVQVQIAGEGGGVGVADGDKGDITVSAAGATWTIDNLAVSNAKLSTQPTMTLKGNATGATSIPSNLTPAQVVTLLATTTDLAEYIRDTMFAALIGTGTVTITQDDVANTITVAGV